MEKYTRKKSINIQKNIMKNSINIQKYTRKTKLTLLYTRSGKRDDGRRISGAKSLAAGIDGWTGHGNSVEKEKQT